MEVLFVRSIRAVSLTAAATAMVGALLAPIPALAAAANKPTLDWVEGLCPSIGTTGLELGRGRFEQALRAEATLADTIAERAPFDIVSPLYMPWSDQLMGITWNGMLMEADENTDWLDQVTSVLVEGGWSQVSAEEIPAGFGWEPLAFTKDVETADGPRKLVIHTEISGAYELRCRDAGLLDAFDREEQGELEEGTPRPVAREFAEEYLIDPASCETPEVQALFATNRSIREAAPEFEKIIPVEDPDHEASRYQERLRTWLIWKMIGSGKIDYDRLWAIEEKVAPEEYKGGHDSMLGFLADASMMIEAEKEGDGAKVCRTMIRMVEKQREIDAAKAARLARINAAFEAEAKKRKISLD